MSAAREAGADSCAAAMVDAVAAEIAESLVLEVPLQEGAPSRWLLRELLAHSEDESEGVAAHCVRLRVDLAAALRAALARWPEAEWLLRSGPGETCSVPPVRVEVRGTAGRSVIFDSFTIGSAPECDVQAFGDATVRPLHCVVISLPGGVAVADFWSGAAEKAFALKHGERISMHVGDRTTVGLGPDARRARRQLPAKMRTRCSSQGAQGAVAHSASSRCSAEPAKGCSSLSKADADLLSQGSTTYNMPSWASCSFGSSRSRSPRRRGASTSCRSKSPRQRASAVPVDVW